MTYKQYQEEKTLEKAHRIFFSPIEHDLYQRRVDTLKTPEGKEKLHSSLTTTIGILNKQKHLSAENQVAHLNTQLETLLLAQAILSDNFNSEELQQLSPTKLGCLATPCDCLSTKTQCDLLILCAAKLDDAGVGSKFLSEALTQEHHIPAQQIMVHFPHIVQDLAQTAIGFSALTQNKMILKNCFKCLNATHQSVAEYADLLVEHLTKAPTLFPMASELTAVLSPEVKKVKRPRNSLLRSPAL